jgi:hypothetical protein
MTAWGSSNWRRKPVEAAAGIERGVDLFRRPNLDEIAGHEARRVRRINPSMQTNYPKNRSQESGVRILGETKSCALPVRAFAIARRVSRSEIANSVTPDS